jgi:hypothetical protein
VLTCRTRAPRARVRAEGDMPLHYIKHMISCLIFNSPREGTDGNTGGTYSSPSGVGDQAGPGSTTGQDRSWLVHQTSSVLFPVSTCSFVPCKSIPRACASSADARTGSER